jgi:hypothetical protein
VSKGSGITGSSGSGVTTVFGKVVKLPSHFKSISFVVFHSNEYVTNTL